MRAYVANSVLLVALKYVSPDCVMEGYDGKYPVLKCTSIYYGQLNDEVRRLVDQKSLKLTLVNVDFTNLKSVGGYVHGWINHLTVINNSLEMKEDAFSEFYSFLSLTVHESRVSTTKFKIREGNYKGGTFVLDLANNAIYNVNSTCDDNPRLETLILNQNKISSLQDHSFGQCPRLKILDLSYNKLTKISMNPFHGLPNLVNLKLQGNVIKEIQPQALTGLQSLEHLDLKYNKLSVFPPIYSDKTLTNLSCNMSDVPLRNLQKLDLGHNKISTIKSCAFELFSNLTELLLNNNVLSHLHLQIFSSLSKLKILNLTNNWFTQIDGAVLRPFAHSLTQLDISYNKLKNFNPKNIMSLVNRLKYLGIAGNYWECHQLEKVILYLNEKDVDTKPHHPVLHYDDNVSGIRCVDTNILKRKNDAMLSNLTARFEEINSFLKESNRNHDNKLELLSNLQIKELIYINSNINRLLYIVFFLIIVITVLYSTYVIVKVCRKIRGKNREEPQRTDQTGIELVSLRSP